MVIQRTFGLRQRQSIREFYGFQEKLVHSDNDASELAILEQFGTIRRVLSFGGGAGGALNEEEEEKEEEEAAVGVLWMFLFSLLFPTIVGSLKNKFQ